MRYRCLYIALLCSTCLGAQSFVLEDNASYILSIYNIDTTGFAAADSADLSPDSRLLLDVYHLFWCSIAEDKPQPMLEAETLLDQLHLSTVDEPVLRVSLALMKMRIALINRSYLSAVKTQTIIKDYFACDEMNDQPYDRFLRGMYHYFVSYGRQSSLWYRLYLASWPPADADRGISYLQEMTASSSILIATEADYFLGRIYLEYENMPDKAYACFKRLTARYPNNPIYADFYEQAQGRMSH